jgi:hypothetical protein
MLPIQSSLLILLGVFMSEIYSKSTAIKVKQYPLGIHLDVEPHSLSTWTTDFSGTASSYLDMFDSVNAAIPSNLTNKLKVNCDIPRWYDLSDYNVTRDGTTKPLSQWVIDKVDTVTIMDY